MRAYKGLCIIGNAQKTGGGFVVSAEELNWCPGKRVYSLLLEPRTRQLCIGFRLGNQ